MCIRDRSEGVQAAVESDEFGYCTEFIIRLSEQGLTIFKEEALKDALARIGNSIVCVQDDDIVKVHVHTCLLYTSGGFACFFCDNM